MDPFDHQMQGFLAVWVGHHMGAEVGAALVVFGAQGLDVGV
jgi:hypothetical protein